MAKVYRPLTFKNKKEKEEFVENYYRGIINYLKFKNQSK